MGVVLTTLLLDSHVVHWVSADEMRRLSPAAARAIDRADELAVASITWWELAWLVRSDRVKVSRPLRSWLDEIALRVQTIALTPAIAETAASLPRAIPNDPADRIILATAIETGYRLVTKDERIRSYPQARKLTIW
jgi:PIN domain nuclease of toxin-antitoxin system